MGIHGESGRRTRRWRGRWTNCDNSPMEINQQCVVALTWILKDTLGEELDVLDDPVEFLVGGDDLFARIEEALQGHTAGDTLALHLEPEEAFGDYQDQLLFLEPRSRFPADIEEGMTIEGSALPEGSNPDAPRDVLYTVAQLYPEHVVLDGNHPWPASRCACTSPCRACARPPRRKSVAARPAPASSASSRPTRACRSCIERQQGGGRSNAGCPAESTAEKKDPSGPFSWRPRRYRQALRRDHMREIWPPFRRTRSPGRRSPGNSHRRHAGRPGRAAP